MLPSLTRGANLFAALMVACALTACTGSENQLFSTRNLPSEQPTLVAQDAGHDAARLPLDARAPDSGGGFVTRSVNPDLDPDASFVWVQTSPGKGGCEAGTYTGGFSCDFGGAGLLGRVTGSISLTLGAGSSSHTLAVTTGQIIAFGDGRDALWQAPITGELACGTSDFTGMTAPPSALLWAGSQLGATLQGKFDPSALALKGQITLRTATQAECVSTWNAVGFR